jgi:hypothetical protein
MYLYCIGIILPVFGHSTEVVNEIFVDKCFGGTHICFPMDIEKLVHVR